MKCCPRCGGNLLPSDVGWSCIWCAYEEPRPYDNPRKYLNSSLQRLPEPAFEEGKQRHTRARRFRD